jgi:DNA modification methylase
MTVAILKGDCREILRKLADESVHCVVTSPPYWGLRDYGTAQWEGGDPSCDHTSIWRNHGDELQSTQKGSSRSRISRDCRKCRAIRIDSQVGLELTLGEYLDVMVEVFREVRRVLRKDGTLWLNLGDSYSSHDPGGYREGEFLNPSGRQPEGPAARNRAGNYTDLPRKNLIGIPWRVAFALQADGWYLRQDIIWSKPNPMPESVTDRCTKAHEYIFLLSKSERYYYDAAAIAEPFADERNGNPGIYARTSQAAKGANRDRQDTGFLNNGGGWNADGARSVRNKRSVWEVTTQPFSEAHFATFPPALIEPCILAGCPKDGTVLDPFGGAGTTGLVADRLQRNAILIELNPEYAAMAEHRIKDDAPLFVQLQQANEYDGVDDFARSIDECYAAVRERKTKGGPGWGGWGE